MASTTGAAAYGIATLRLCSEQSQLQRTSYLFTLCGMSGELLAKAPVEAAKEPPLYSWRYADGTKPTLMRLSFIYVRLRLLLRRSFDVVETHAGQWVACVDGCRFWVGP